MDRRDCAALVPPRPNRAACFDGTLLHAVVPGKGPAPSAAARRVTLMISYWKKPHARPSRSEEPEAAMAFPGVDEGYDWAMPFYAGGPWALRSAKHMNATGDGAPQPASPVPVGALWARLPGSDGDAFGPVPLPPYDACFQGF